MFGAVGELKEVLNFQRAIQGVALVSCFFAGFSPFQMAEVASAGMPHYPDLMYMFGNGLLPLCDDIGPQPVVNVYL